MSAESKTIHLADDLYPELLREINDPPSTLHIKGSFSAWEDPCVAIVGTRKATAYGLGVARRLARELASAGVAIISGLALGVDAEAHRGALEAGGKTVAVLGSGLNKIYPAANQTLAKKIIENGGAIISEFPPDQGPERWTFPQRNRIVAGLSLLTLVIEAPEKSGALITAYLALDYNREVGALPGETTSVNSRGTNKLIKEGAALIASARDVLDVLGIAPPTPEERPIKKLDETEEIVLKHLNGSSGADELLQKTSLPAEILNQKLTSLELKGIIKNAGGSWYKI